MRSAHSCIPLSTHSILKCFFQACHKGRFKVKGLALCITETLRWWQRLTLGRQSPNQSILSIDLQTFSMRGSLVNKLLKLSGPSIIIQYWRKETHMHHKVKVCLVSMVWVSPCWKLLWLYYLALFFFNAHSYI